MMRACLALLTGTVLIASASCESCMACEPEASRQTATQVEVSPPPSRDASLQPGETDPRDEWMNQRIQHILQRQREGLEAASLRPRPQRGTTDSESAQLGKPDLTELENAPGSAAEPGEVVEAVAPVSARAVHDPALERRLAQELEELRAEIERVEALSRAVQAKVRTADNRDTLQGELQRITAELADLKALQKALRGELQGMRQNVGP
ncbi:MAG: hypothetical protein ABIJ09_03720 [Pseudomonadota bacterium]